MKNMLGILESFLCQVPLPLDLDVETGGDVRHKDVDQLTYTEHHVLEYNYECKLEGENLPVNRSGESELISESSVVTLRLELDTV